MDFVNSTSVNSSTVEVWDVELVDIFSSQFLFTIAGACVIFGLGTLVLWRAGDLWIADLFGGAVLCLQDVVSDWLLIEHWYRTGNNGWASWMLFAILQGGLGTMISDPIYKWNKEATAIFEKNHTFFQSCWTFIMDALGFAVIRSLYSKYRLQAELNKRLKMKNRTQNGSGEESKGSSVRDEVLNSGNDLSRSNTIYLKEKLGGLSAWTISFTLVESFISFCIVSYVLISGTVSLHEDVQKPSQIEWFSWLTSYLGLVYKCMALGKLMMEGSEDEESSQSKNTFSVEMICSASIYAILTWFVILYYTFFFLLPAFILAQNRNSVIIPIFPEVFSSSVGLAYLMVYLTWYTAIYSKSFMLNRKYGDGNNSFRLSILLVSAVSTIWLSMIQIWIQFYGVFRTNLGRIISYYWTIGAFMGIMLEVFGFVKIFWELCFAEAAEEDVDGSTAASSSLSLPSQSSTSGIEIKWGATEHGICTRSWPVTNPQLKNSTVSGWVEL